VREAVVWNTVFVAVHKPWDSPAVLVQRQRGYGRRRCGLGQLRVHAGLNPLVLRAATTRMESMSASAAACCAASAKLRLLSLASGPVRVNAATRLLGPGSVITVIFAPSGRRSATTTGWSSHWLVVLRDRPILSLGELERATSRLRGVLGQPHDASPVVLLERRVWLDRVSGMAEHAGEGPLNG